MRRSHDRAGGLGPLHRVSAWASERGLALGQIATEEKSNEITAIPQLLDKIDVQGAVVTIDAMGCQKEIAKKISSAGGERRVGGERQSTEVTSSHRKVFHRSVGRRF